MVYGFHLTQEREYQYICSYEWNVLLGKVSEAQQMGGAEPQGGETLAKSLIAGLNQ